MSAKASAIILCNNPNQVEYVFAPHQLAEIASLTNLRPGVVTADDLKKGGFEDVEYVFSTWGIPVLTEAEIARYLPRLTTVFYAAGATDHFARPMFARNVTVLSAWLANAIPVAEFCVAQILLGLKGYFHCNRINHSPEGWREGRQAAGPGIYGETVALIGAGAISRHVQELLKAFNVKVIVVNSRPEKRVISLEEAFRTAFVVSNHLPNRDDNIGVLDGKLFASMRPGATFINTGRGAQVNEAEMIEVLEQRPDLTALLDVTHPEPPASGSKLYTLPNVQLSSHIAGSINDEVHRMADYMISELRHAVAGEPFQYQVTESMLLTSKQ